MSRVDPGGDTSPYWVASGRASSVKTLPNQTCRATYCEDPLWITEQLKIASSLSLRSHFLFSPKTTCNSSRYFRSVPAAVLHSVLLLTEAVKLHRTLEEGRKSSHRNSKENLINFQIKRPYTDWTLLLKCSQSDLKPCQVWNKTASKTQLPVVFPASDNMIAFASVYMKPIKKIRISIFKSVASTKVEWTENTTKQINCT